MENAMRLLDAQSRCTREAQAILNEPTARAYCTPRCGPFDHVHVTIREDGADMDHDPRAYWDSADEDECYGDPIPGAGLLQAALQRIFPGVGLSIVVCA